ncbi:hypothetical protein [Arthrobacter sp. IK3]|uniref:hypothetical protein n=1 Tax=Arthrobacter sp. IK3 TaxID=3448169 RepID=UPI003EE3AE90
MTLLRVPHGYRLSPGTGPEEFLHRLAAVMNPVRDRLDAEQFIELAVDSIDRADVYGRPRPAAPLDDACAAWAAEQETMNRNLVWFDPNSLAVRIGRDPATGRHLIIAATDRRPYIDALEAMPEVENYRYQAIIESIPDGISDEEWQERADAWTRMLPGGSSEGMDLWNLREPGDARTRQVIAAVQSAEVLASAYNPMTRESRAHRRAAEKYAQYLCAEHGFDMMPAIMRANRVPLPALQGVIHYRLAAFSSELLATGSGASAFTDLDEKSWAMLSAKDHEAVEEERARAGL